MQCVTFWTLNWQFLHVYFLKIFLVRCMVCRRCDSFVISVLHSGGKPLARFLCCDFGQGTLLLQCFSPYWSSNRFERTARDSWQNAKEGGWGWVTCDFLALHQGRVAAQFRVSSWYSFGSTHVYSLQERVLCTYMMFSAPFNEIQLKKMNF